jgi:hypothetical protein
MRNPDQTGEVELGRCTFMLKLIQG